MRDMLCCSVHSNVPEGNWPACLTRTYNPGATPLFPSSAFPPLPPPHALGTSDRATATPPPLFISQLFSEFSCADY